MLRSKSPKTWKARRLAGREGLIQAPLHLNRNRDTEGSDHPHAPPEDGLLSQIHACTTVFSLRKEVIQPQVLLRLPCYDFTPILNYTLPGCFLAVSSPASRATHFRDVTGGVYKARERIHRGMLIHDY
jgi:hypothetical protein